MVPVILRPTPIEDEYKTLQRKYHHHRKPIISFWLTHDRSCDNWTKEETHEHMINQTMFHLGEHIKLVKFKANPLLIWDDAHWVYGWKCLNSSAALNTWLAILLENPCGFLHAKS